MALFLYFYLNKKRAVKVDFGIKNKKIKTS